MKSQPIKNSQLHRILLLLCMFGPIAGGVASAQSPILEKMFKPLKRNGHPPVTHSDPAVEELAKNLDWLEHQLEQWGSIVPKTPDIWGDARLTKYRREVEEVLEENVRTFDESRISATSRLTDRASLENELMLEPIATTSGSTSSSSSSAQSNSTTASAASATSASASGGSTPTTASNETNSSGKTLGLEQIEYLDQLKRYLDHLNELRRINEGDDISDSPGYALNLVRVPISVMPGQRTREGFGAEATLTVQPVYDDRLLPNTFKDLVINDVIDQLAIPVTQLLNRDRELAKYLLEKNDPERIIEQYKTIAVKQNYFIYKDKCVNELLEQMISDGEIDIRFYTFIDKSGKLKAIPHDIESITQFAKEINEINERFLTQKKTKIEKNKTDLDLLTLADLAYRENPVKGSLNDAIGNLGNASKSQIFKELNIEGNSPQGAVGEEELKNWAIGKLPKNSDENVDISKLDQKLESLRSDLKNLQCPDESTLIEKVRLQGGSEFQKAADRLRQFDRSIIANQNSRRSTLPFPPRHLADNLGEDSIECIITSIVLAFHEDVINRRIIHLTDVQAFLREELAAAYELLSQPDLASVWLEAEASESRLARYIRLRDLACIDRERQMFLSQSAELEEGVHQGLNDLNSMEPSLCASPQDCTTRALAWALYVESMLLNERLKESMRETLGEGQCAETLAFFGPNPNPEACAQFNRYVSARWPIHVFTVDPVVSEQNISVSSQIYRDAQLKVLASFSGGAVSGSNATRLLRQIQRDMATIDLNRTVVGFAHGDQTFGWRFYPRFQVAPVEGNAKVLFRDLIAGGPSDEHLLRSRRIEPGMRECVAIVVMPSFVGRATIDSRSSWFRLDSPKHSAMSHQESVQYSRSIETMKYHAQACVRCPELYREGEVSRLMTRVDQLSHQLPMQSLSFPVPTENTLGGFEIFASGTRELAPELLGWYGAPGYSTDEGAHFFLAGDNFSVHQTSLIAGNQVIQSESIRMLSRQILEVKLPKNLPFVTDIRMNGADEDTYAGYIDLHLATPYGVSGHLLIPVLKSEPPPPVDNTPVLQDTAPVIHLYYSEKNGVCQIVQIAPCDLPIAQIATNANGIPGGVPATITMKPASDQGVLKPVTFAPISPDRNAVYNLQGTSVMDAAAPKGPLFVSLEEYGNWLLKCPDGNCDSMDGSSVALSFTAEIAFGDASPIKAKGKSHLILVLKKLPSK